jgi:hypothetical protein
VIHRRDRDRFRRVAAAISPKSDPLSRWITLLAVGAIGAYLLHIASLEIEFRQGRWPRDCPFVEAFRSMW